MPKKVFLSSEYTDPRLKIHAMHETVMGQSPKGHQIYRNNVIQFSSISHKGL